MANIEAIAGELIRYSDTLSLICAVLTWKLCLMNTKLVDSLVQIIEALTPEENVLLQERLKNMAIQQTAGVCGGNARIRSTRIPVWTLISFRKQGADDEELLRNYPGLTKEDLTSAWSYYDRHRAEIDLVMASHQEDGLDG